MVLMDKAHLFAYEGRVGKWEAQVYIYIISQSTRADFAVGSAVLVTIIEILRRIQHGREVPPTVSSQTVDEVNKTNWFLI